jgi:RNA polymerase sigma factor for flagellar operon FliA
LKVVEARELLETNLELVGRAVTFVCRRYRFDPEDADDFRSAAHMKLIENEYAILRSYQGRSSLSTYLSVVIQHWALDYRIHEWGKWHTSAEAKRLGAVAVELEQFVHRDGRSIEEAFPFLAVKHPGVTLDALRLLAAQLPRRAPRRHDVPVEDAETVAVQGPHAIEDQALAGERRRTAEVVGRLMRDAIAKRPDDERLILQLRFEEGLTVAQIARALQRDQKLLYRQLGHCMREIRAEILDSGLAPDDVLDLIGRDDTFLSFDLGKGAARPSK